ncbi:MAG: glutathione S-transferase N-terminal domain-containing protein [Myxococcota bacterium]
MASALDLALSHVASWVRFGSGGRVGRLGPRPEHLLELYEFEGCPFCRKVREALSILDLDAIVHPCPKGGPRFRPELVARGGKARFPYLVDPNQGVELYESDDILRHLVEHYGDGRLPPALSAGPLTDLGAVGVGLLRGKAGSFYRPAKPPEQRLELFSFEASPACRLVRERLSVLELPYVLRNRAPGSRRPLPPGVGRGDLPHLVDPNAGEALSGADAVLHHLDARYTA